MSKIACVALLALVACGGGRVTGSASGSGSGSGSGSASGSASGSGSVAVAAPVPDPLQPDIDAYQAFLDGRGVGDVLPIEELLHGAHAIPGCPRRLRRLVPPRESWPRMVAPLELLRRLRTEGLLGAATVASAYRNEAANTCSGGSPRSKHLTNGAIDIVIPEDATLRTRLCTFWRKRGKRLRFGLGFYDATHLHLDALGYRTWGPTYKRASSMCLRTP